MDLEKAWQEADAAMRQAHESHDCEGIDEAVSMRIAVASCAKRENPENYPAALINVISSLLVQADECDSKAAINQAFDMLYEHEALFSSDQLTVAYLGLKAYALMVNAQRQGDPGIMRQSVDVYRRREKISPKEDTNFAQHRLEFGIALREFGLMSGSWREIYEAVAVLRSLERRRDSSISGILFMVALGNALLSRFLHNPRSYASDLADAIDALTAAVQDVEPRDPNAASYISDLGAALMRDYEYRKNSESLIAAIERHRQAVEATPDSHARRGERMYNLASALMTDHERTDDPGTLDQAIEWFRAAIGATGPDSAHYARCLYQLATALFRRGELRDIRFDYDEAAARAGQAVDATPADSVNRAERAAFHGVALTALGAGSQLLPAEELLRAAVQQLPRHNPGRTRVESNHGVILEALARKTSSPDESRRYAKEAVELTGHAVSTTPIHHSEYPGRLLNFASASVTWARIAADHAALDGPLDLCHAAQESGIEDLHDSLIELASAQLLSCKFELLDDEAAAGAAIRAYQRAAELPDQNTIRRLNAACHGADLATRLDSPDEGLALYTLAIELLDRAAWRGIHRRDQERLLGAYGRLPSNAAGMAMSAGQLELAVEFLERGRGVLMDRLSDDSADLTLLAKIAPDLEEDLERTRRALEAADLPDVEADVVDMPSRPANEASEADKRSGLARELDGIVNKVHETAGCGQLFRPAEFADLQAAVGERLVTIINVGDYRCDALNFTSAGLTVTPLPSLTRQEAEDAAEFFRDHARKAARSDQTGWNARRELVTSLDTLWDWVAEPVLSAFGITDAVPCEQAAPHIYWCPTGPAVFLPLHAAGKDLGAQSSAGRSVIDRAESSYLPKLRILARHRQFDTQPGWDERPLIVSMPTTPGLRPLPGATRDAAYLLGLFPAATHLSCSAASRNAVLEAIRTHAWHHFSLHGVTDIHTPTAGGLQLSGGRLTIHDLAALSLTTVRFTFLSACETYQGASGVPDEVITLGGAFLSAGCTTVIATLWPVQDDQASDVVRRLYEDIVTIDCESARLDPDRSSGAMRSVALALRDAQPGHPERWAAFVHATVN